MIRKIFQILLFLGYFILLIATVSCSTKKNKFLNRKYHSVTAHYNAFFNGNESLKEGIATLNAIHIDDYSNVLSVYKLGTQENAQSIFPQMDLAIKKGSISIQKHSMFIKNKEYNKWIDKCYMIIGIAQYYKKDYELAISTFEYIVAQFPNPIKAEALLWIVKCYNEKHQYEKSQYYFDQIKESIKKKTINKYTEKEYPIVLADFYIKQKNYESAIKPLTDAIKLNKNKKNKTRLTFILAQVYEKNNNLKKASIEYSNVLKLKPPYEMAFNARINLAKCYEANASNSKEIKKELTKMLKDKKNKDYLDQIYASFAEIALKEGDTLSAIKYLKLSTRTSISNTKQKATSFLNLANIYFSQRDYEPAALNYDSAIVFLPKDYPNYNDIINKKNILNKLVKNIKTVQLEDSLQVLSKMSPKEQENFVQKIIDNLIKEEQKKLQEEMEKQQLLMITQNNNNQNNTYSGGQWYFYNTSTVSFGYSEFTKKWGNRKLEDNWRLSNKMMTVDFGEDLTNANIENTIDSTGKTTITNKKDKNYYLKNIPNTKGKIDSSNNSIFQALSAMGAIYQDELLDNPYAIETYEEILKRFSEEQFNLCPVYYQLYRLYKQSGNTSKSDYYKNLIYSKYPETDYAQLLKNPDYSKNQVKNENEAENYYQLTYHLFEQNNYVEVINNALKAKKLFNKNKLLPKFDYLKALAIAKTQPVDSFELALNNIIKNYPDSSEIRNLSLLSLDYISKNKKLNATDSTGKQTELNNTIFKNEPEDIHFYMMIVNIVSNNINFNELKYKVSDYNSKYYSSSDLNLSNAFYDDKSQYILVSNFDNKDKAMLYFNGIKNSKEVFVDIDPAFVIQFVISVDNFSTFYKNRNLVGYLEYFKKVYLK